MRKPPISFNFPPHKEDAKVLAEITNYLNGVPCEADSQEMLIQLFGPWFYLTKSCTHCLELIARLIGFDEGDEVIIPAFGFPTMASAFLSAGANLIFADSRPDHPNIDPVAIEKLITAKTKALVILHYGGCPCDMDSILTLVDKYDLVLVEDAAHAIGSYWQGQHLGTLGDYGAISFHRTKNVSCEEGGLLIIRDNKDEAFINSLCDKGTNQKAFSQGLVESYEWVSLGSAYRLPDLLISLLGPQLGDLPKTTQHRLQLWDLYYEAMWPLKLNGAIELPSRPPSHNAHIFHFIVESRKERTALQEYLLKRGVETAFHYQSLSESSMAKSIGVYSVLDSAHKFQEQLLRLPIHKGVTYDDIEEVINAVYGFYK